MGEGGQYPPAEAGGRDALGYGGVVSIFVGGVFVLRIVVGVDCSAERNGLFSVPSRRHRSPNGDAVGFPAWSLEWAFPFTGTNSFVVGDIMFEFASAHLM